LNYSPISVSLI